MILALKLWLGWHLMLALVGLALRAPHAWWQKLPHGSGFKIKLGGRFWPIVDFRDGWIGFFANPDRRRFYFFLCPFFGVRVDLARRQADAGSILRLLYGEEGEEKRVRALSNERLGVELCNRAWSRFAMGSLPAILIGEAMDRLRSLPDVRSGAARIARERLRQIQDCNWSAAHDDAHVDGQLADAASCYALTKKGPYRDEPHLDAARRYRVPFRWPWDGEWWKPGDRDRELEKAGALIAAELDRRERLRNVPSQFVSGFLQFQRGKAKS